LLDNLDQRLLATGIAVEHLSRNLHSPSTTLLRMSPQNPRTTPRQDQVTVLVHGIWMQGVMMGVLSKKLQRQGFRTHCVSYEFLSNTPEQNAQKLYEDIGYLGARTINLVGHSLGGIVILHLLNQYPELDIDKIVLIGSPVNGSSVAKRMHKSKVLRPLLGRSVDGGLLGGAPAFNGEKPLGIITGTGKLGITTLLYPTGADSDGVVKNCETLIDNATDRITVPRSHSGLIYSGKCATYVANFLNYGRFRP